MLFTRHDMVIFAFLNLRNGRKAFRMEGPRVRTGEGRNLGERDRAETEANHGIISVHL